MDIYRALDNLSIGIRQYEVFPASRLNAKALKILEQRRKIAKVTTPPLEIVLPDYNELVGVTFEQLFDREDCAALQQAALKTLQPEPICRGCSRR